MKNMLEINEKKVPAVRIDPSLDKYHNVVLFPEKLAKAMQLSLAHKYLQQLPSGNRS